MHTNLCPDFVVELRRPSKDCEFIGFLEDILRDMFVCGLKSEITQRKLLIEPDLTLMSPVKVAENNENAIAKAKLLEGHNNCKALPAQLEPHVDPMTGHDQQPQGKGS